jgi:replicative DNA helicase
LDHAVLRNLLSSKFYKENKGRLKPSLFGDDASDLYKILVSAHDKYDHDLTSRELMALYEMHNPVATTSDKAIIKDMVNAIANTEPMSDDVASDVIADMWRKAEGLEIANLGVQINEGSIEAYDKLLRKIEDNKNGFTPDDFGTPTTKDIFELMAETTDDSRWAFNISTIKDVCYGIGPSEFGIVFATPNTGKTAFVISLCCAPGGFCDQGAKVLYLGNEEKTSRTMYRAMQAWSGMDKYQIKENPTLCRQKFEAIENNIQMFDVQDWTLAQIEAKCESEAVDVLIIDQADKVQIEGNYNASHERLRELYRRLREVAKRQDCAVIAVSQASADAEKKTRLSFTMMEGSKIGKAAESDLILGVGRHNAEVESNEPDHTRFVTISKNKLSGWHGTIICNIQPEVSRYVE